MARIFLYAKEFLGALEKILGISRESAEQATKGSEPNIYYIVGGAIVLCLAGQNFYLMWKLNQAEDEIKECMKEMEKHASYVKELKEDFAEVKADIKAGRNPRCFVDFDDGNLRKVVSVNSAGDVKIIMQEKPRTTVEDVGGSQEIGQASSDLKED